MSLDDYRRKRDFDRTPEPKGKKRGASRGRRFVIQLHRARHLHFDLRLELRGTLKSWAVPKGLSLDPADKRLAVHVEDHPLEYAEFEGIIPEGEYGAGAVIVWDQGEWEPIGDPDAGYRNGDLKFLLNGQKLQGKWALVRMRPKPGEPDDKNWLVIKEKDEAVVAAGSFDIVTERPESVLTGRTLAEVAAGTSQARKGKPKGKNLLQQIKQTDNVQAGPLPVSLAPALARMVAQPPNGEQWLHEIKLDGYRILAWLDNGQVQLRTRHGHDWTKRFPELAAAIASLPANSALFDGEVVALLPNGASSFTELQQALSGRRTGSLVYFVFDLLHLDGYNLRQAALSDRKALLRQVLAGNTNARVHYVDDLVGDGAAFFTKCREMELEGIVSKRRSSPYRSGRTDEWLKCKCVQSEPFVVGGFTSNQGSSHVRALVLGYHDNRGRLVYAGRVGSGFDEKMIATLERQLPALERPDCPFSVVPPKEPGQKLHWVLPQLIAQVRFAGWSADGVLRHPTFAGLRDDSEPAEIVREVAGKVTPERPVAAKASKKKRQPAPAAMAPSVLESLSDLHLTNPQKIVYPDVGLTKLDLVKYYVAIADWILPHVIDRPLTLVRCPDGQGAKSFYQKHSGAAIPDAVHRLVNDGEELLFIRDLKGLISLVQASVLEIHTWGAKIDRLDRPDRLIIDLDPDEPVPWPTVVQAALRVRDRLQLAGLTSFANLTGGKGVHIVAPLARKSTWDELHDFAHQFAQRLSADFPQFYTNQMAKRARAGKIYIDYLRNRRGATAVAPYSTRNRPGAPVATPIAWAEITSTDGRPDLYTVQTLAARLQSLNANPWEGIEDLRQSLSRESRASRSM